MMDGAFVSVAQAALMIGVLSADEIVREVRRGHLDGRKVGRRWLIRRASVEHWISGDGASLGGLALPPAQSTCTARGGRGTRAAEGALAVLRGGAS